MFLPLCFAHPSCPSSSSNTCPFLVPTCPHPPSPSSSLPFAPPSTLVFFPRRLFCHHVEGVVSPHVPLFSANKLPCGPPAPHLPVSPSSCFTPRPTPASSFSHCSSHHYVSGDTRLFCIRLFSPLWQAGQHANMQNGDGEAFCSVMRKGRQRKRCVCVYLCVIQQSLWLIRAMVGTGARATRTKAQLTNMVMEYQPKQP